MFRFSERIEATQANPFIMNCEHIKNKKPYIFTNKIVKPVKKMKKKKSKDSRLHADHTFLGGLLSLTM